jgi:hypothetical protein
MSNRVAALGDLDVTTEDGYREFTRRSIELLRDLGKELEFVAAVVGTALENTPTNDPKDNARRQARKVRGYLRRSAQAQVFCAGQVSGAFRLTEQTFIPKQQKTQRGMRMNRNRKTA